MTKQPTNNDLQVLAMNNSLGDGVYLTTPKWGYSERLVKIYQGVVQLLPNEMKNYPTVTIKGYKFSQFNFFEVNNVIKLKHSLFSF